MGAGIQALIRLEAALGGWVDLKGTTLGSLVILQAESRRVELVLVSSDP